MHIDEITEDLTVWRRVKVSGDDIDTMDGIGMPLDDPRLGNGILPDTVTVKYELGRDRDTGEEWREIREVRATGARVLASGKLSDKSRGTVYVSSLRERWPAWLAQVIDYDTELTRLTGFHK